MSYDFNFDLSRISQSLFKEIANFSRKERVHEKLGAMAQKMVEKFHVEKNTGLSLNDSITIIEDLISIQINNSLLKKHFEKTNKRALLLPHCSRKYMDSRCKAEFDTKTASYICKHCSKDCIVNKATNLAKKNNYDVYILPGGSCIRKICNGNIYQGIIGVACTDELRLGMEILNKKSIPVQCIPLVKNGCSNTRFNLDTLSKAIQNEN